MTGEGKYQLLWCETREPVSISTRWANLRLNAGGPLTLPAFGTVGAKLFHIGHPDSHNLDGIMCPIDELDKQIAIALNVIVGDVAP